MERQTSNPNRSISLLLGILAPFTFLSCQPAPLTEEQRNAFINAPFGFAYTEDAEETIQVLGEPLSDESQINKKKPDSPGFYEPAYFRYTRHLVYPDLEVWVSTDDEKDWVLINYIASPKMLIEDYGITSYPAIEEIRRILGKPNQSQAGENFVYWSADEGIFLNFVYEGNRLIEIVWTKGI
jgi:hypothetical protein